MSAPVTADEVREALDRLSDPRARLPREQYGPSLVFRARGGVGCDSLLQLHATRRKVEARVNEGLKGKATPCTVCGGMFVRPQARQRRCSDCVRACKGEPRVPLPVWVPALLLLLVAACGAERTPAPADTTTTVAADTLAPHDSAVVPAPPAGLQIEPHCPDRHLPCATR
jgi:hypothetical protein